MALPLIWIGIAALVALRKKTDEDPVAHPRTLGEVLTGGSVHQPLLFAGAAGEQQRNRFRIPAPANSTVAQTPRFAPTFKPPGFR